MIRASNLSKFYGGKRALGPVSFEITDGETVGFLGLNGAGKTTALRILACDLRPSAGTIEVGGVDAVAEPHEVRKRIGFLPENPPLYTDMIVTDYLRFSGELRGMTKAEVGGVNAIAEPHEVRKRIGFLPENPPLYADMVVTDYLRFSGELRGMTKAEVKRRMPEVLEITDLTDVANDPIGTLSHGYRQRVGVAQAIVHDPKFLILDEPTRGLDPVQIVEMRNLIHDLKQNHTVLISSHILTEISQTCDRLLVLGRGKLLGAGREQDLATSESEIRQVTVVVRPPSGDDPRGQIRSVLATVDGVKTVADPYEQGGGLAFALQTTKDCRAEVSRAVVAAKLDLLKLDYARSELENTFIRLVGGADASN